MPRQKMTDDSNTASSTYEIVNHGIDHCQYFQGCGVSFSHYDAAFTGAADSPYAALEEALFEAAMSGYNTNDIVNNFSKKCHLTREQIDNGEIYYYVSVRMTNARLTQ